MTIRELAQIVASSVLHGLLIGGGIIAAATAVVAVLDCM